MNFNLILTFDDYLTYHLYAASKKKTVKQTRTRAWIAVTAAFTVLGLVFLQTGNNFFAYYFLGFGVISLVCYPFYQRRHYKNHYKKHVAEGYQNKIGKLCEIDFQADYIFSKDSGSESKIKTSEISEINEIGTHIFIKINTGESLVIPKEQIDQQAFWAAINEITEGKDVEINKELDWRWK